MAPVWLLVRIWVESLPPETGTTTFHGAFGWLGADRFLLPLLGTPWKPRATERGTMHGTAPDPV